ncbi:putative nitroreductase [Sphingobium sp. SYK-6]|uniref:nitroreductase family protein n=1 Tax=Sphingobium sp. (strain NBRC 103272 / SYK-6) TaxID=627192 RepID=UPI0002277213|nr:nitroreductase family protein [Sphingobium sp. SYK-6]BAK65907.1 putative nitroreductase [Sphingobium sp. SYK-6]
MTNRTTDTALDKLFLDRWSPRAFDGSAIPDADLRTILDAGRWAPSAYNYQPWRILYAVNGDANWETFLSILVPFNQSWAKNASVLLFFVSDTLMQLPESANPSHSHSFDTGAAWAQIGLQAHMLGYHAHGMTGIDFDKARDLLAVPERFRVEAAAAIGRATDPSILPEGLREREVPSDRKPLVEIAYPGKFVA